MSFAEQIQQKLTSAFSPSHVEVECESHLHNVPAGSEIHFRVVLVSDAFSQLRKVQRHQQVYGVLADEMAGAIHALALHLYTPDEWAGQAPASPQCQGGSKSP